MQQIGSGENLEVFLNALWYVEKGVNLFTEGINARFAVCYEYADFLLTGKINGLDSVFKANEEVLITAVLGVMLYIIRI